MVKNKWNIEKKSLVFTLKSGYVEMIDTFVFRKNQKILYQREESYDRNKTNFLVLFTE